ncbi:MAG: hypothetical protein IPF49_06015 [Gammaproteobacteria bacterium]|nr:hypothetical protein [Gammaproteobacteria bacterium]
MMTQAQQRHRPGRLPVYVEDVTVNGQWIGPDESLTVGQVGFLVEHHNTLAGWRRHDVRDLPARTNQSLEPRLHGWCGSYNDISTHARGMVRVERMAENSRAFVRELEGDELAAALEDLGYPGLE